MKKQFVSTVITLGMTAILYASPAQAENISPATPSSIMELIKAEGSQSELVVPEDDGPYIESLYGNLKYLVLFLNCDDSHRNCKTIQFYTGFGDAKHTTLERFNEWNKSKRFARAYRDSGGKATLEMDLDMDFKGLPRENVVESLNTWKNLMDEYRAFLFDT